MAANKQKEEKPPSTTRRMIWMLVGVGVVLGLLVGFQMFKAHMMKSWAAKNAAPPMTVSAMKAEFQEWQPQIDGVGSLRAVRGVEVTAEIDGMVRSLHFKSGERV